MSWWRKKPDLSYEAKMRDIRRMLDQLKGSHQSNRDRAYHNADVESGTGKIALCSNLRVAMGRLVFLCVLHLASTVIAFAQSKTPTDDASRDHLLRQYYCGSGAFLNWNLTCKVTKNTIGPKLFAPFDGIQTIQ